MTNKCSVQGCERRSKSKGYCMPHYQKWRRHGDPLKFKHLKGVTLTERFWSYVATVPDSDACWEWQSYKDPNGYGRLNVRQSSKTYIPKLAHRISYELAVCEIPEGKHVCHKCDNPGCVNPSHLFIGDAAANCSDKIAKGRMRYGVSRGEKHGRARLTEKMVREIRASVGPSRVVAEKYGISSRQVRAVRSREVWQHVE